MLIYRIFLLLFAPVLTLRLAARLMSGNETLAGLKERLAIYPAPFSGVPVIWLHGASNGELTAARRLIERIGKDIPRYPVLLTCSTVSARDMVSGWGMKNVAIRLAPLDYPNVLRRFLRRNRPVVSIVLENELWPMRMVLTHTRSIPLLMIGARISERSAHRWRFFRALLRRMITSITALAPMDMQNAKRFMGLGLEKERLLAPVNLKASVQMSKPDANELARLSRVFDWPHTILAASTHEGEDEIILEAFKKARKMAPGLHMIIAPRHPGRGAAIADLARKAGLSTSRRSCDGVPAQAPDVYVADTLGEMSLFYSLASRTVLGGSFVPKGGHSPLEAAQFATRILHGPDTSNHHEAYKALASQKAAISAGNAKELAALFACPAQTEAQLRQRLDKAISSLPNSDESIRKLVETIAHYTTDGSKH